MADDYVPVRLSHLLRHCSVGAIVRGADSLVVVPDIRSWDPPGGDPRQREIRYVDQVRRTLGIRQALCTPPRRHGARRHGARLDTGPAVPPLDALPVVRTAAPQAVGAQRR